MPDEPSPRPWRVDGIDISDANGEPVTPLYFNEQDEANARFIVDAVNERDKLKAECDRLRTAYADLWRAVKRIEADSRLCLGTGLEVASSALHYVHTYASSAIRAAEKKGLAPAIGEDKP